MNGKDGRVVLESEEELHTLIHTVPVGMLVFDQNKELLFSNTYAETMFGKVENEIRGKKCGDFIDCVNRNEVEKGCGEAEECSGCLLNRALDRVLDEESHVYSDRGVTLVRLDSSPETSYLSFRATALQLNSRTCALLALYDITEQKKAEIQLRNSSEEKTRLMREMNHRIKNNLTLVSSLISLKQKEVGGAVDLSDIRSQIDSIGLIHEKLYTARDSYRIDLVSYFEDLTRSVFSLYSGGAVEVDRSIEVESLPTDLVINFGLILNELATNAMKHGFTGEETPRFTVKLEYAGTGAGAVAGAAAGTGTGATGGSAAGTGECVFTLSNTGRPFPEDVEVESRGTQGLRLVSALVRQMDGSMELQRRPYPVFSIRIPL